MTHYIIYKLKNEEDYSKICDELTLVLESMKKDIEGVKAYSFVKNAFKGNFENGYAFAGSNAWKATRIMSVHETITELLEGWKRASAPAVVPV